MSRHPYLVHRATKRIRPSLLELDLLDRDLADAGVHLHWTPEVDADAVTRVWVLYAVRDALLAA